MLLIPKTISEVPIATGMRFALNPSARTTDRRRTFAAVNFIERTTRRSSFMMRNAIRRAGNMKWGLIALLLGLPLPIVLLIWLFVGR